MSNQDFALKNGDLFISDGDLVISESDNQHTADTLNAFPGWWKENPADGVGVFGYMNSAGKEQEVKRKMTIQLQADGYTVNNPIVEVDASGNMNIEPNATV